MTRLSFTFRTALAATAVALSFGLHAELLQVDYSDPANFGFNDTTPVEPVPGNPATTLGEQRRAVFDKAVDIWSSRLDSASRVRVIAFFEDIGCGETTTLGLGGSLGLSRNFANAPKADTNYPISVATALRGQIYSQFDAEIRVRFNFRIDSEACSENLDGFWYGLDPEVPPPLRTASFLELTLHELGHGLGFQSLTDREDRTFFGDPPVPDVMSDLIFDVQRDASWTELTAPQRVQSATSGSNLVWTGERTNLRAAERLLPPAVIIALPAVITTTRPEPAWIQGYPPFVPITGLESTLALAQGPGPGPEPGDPWHRALACEPLDNAADVAGRLVLVRRGECFFATKWQNVFDAGGVGIIIVDNQPPGSEGAIERDFGIAVDRNLPIPIWLVSDPVGTLLLGNAGTERPVTLAYAPNQPPRGTNQGFINLQASTENTDSNVSHFATSLAPRSLMNPNLTNIGFGGDLDQVPELLYDIGWPDASSKQAQYSGNWFNPDRNGEGCQLTMDGGQTVSVLTCYMYRDGEQFWIIGTGSDLGDRYEFNEMSITSGADYGADFDPADVEVETWGRIVMRPIDCNQARFDFSPLDPALPEFSSQMQKIIGASCNQLSRDQINRERSGNYFDPNRNGEGIQLALEADALSWVLTFYTYLDGEQVWMIGSGRRAGDQITFEEVNITRGGQYGPAFDPAGVELIPFGRFDLTLLDCNNVELAISSERPEFSSDTRTLTRITPRDCG